MLLQRCTLRLHSAVKTDCRGSGGVASLSACSLNQQLDRPRWILPEAAAALQSRAVQRQGTGEKSTHNPLHNSGWLVRWMSGWLVAELSPAFPLFPRGAVTRQNVHSPNPREQQG